MEIQRTLKQFERGYPQQSLIELEKNPLYLEQEKKQFILNLCSFIDRLNLNPIQIIGRPRADFRDIIKSLLIMSYNSMSYRRTYSDLQEMKNKGLLNKIPPRSTLNDYANKKEIIHLLSKLIQISALFFIDNENTLILDSSWFGLNMYTGGYKKVYNKKLVSSQKCRKIHIACLKNSKVICYAKTTAGTVNDAPLFEEIVKAVVHNGFKIQRLIADAGYLSKKNYAICNELNIVEAYINFKSNSQFKRAKSSLWKERLRLFKEGKEAWHEVYRFRVIVEGIFSSLKRKGMNYLRSKNENAQDVELLLKALVHNITLMGKYSQ